MKSTFSVVGCFAVVYTIIDDVYKVVLVRRKNNGVLELPGGGLDINLDITSNTDPFENCVVREVKEESGIDLDIGSLIKRSILVQRVPVGTNSYCVGSVHLYSQRYSKLNDDDHRDIIILFTSDESSEVVITPVDKDFFKNKDISLAARRMIAIALNGVDEVNNTHVTQSALSLPVYIGRLGNTVFNYTIMD